MGGGGGGRPNQISSTGDSSLCSWYVRNYTQSEENVIDSIAKNLLQVGHGYFEVIRLQGFPSN